MEEEEEEERTVPSVSDRQGAVRRHIEHITETGHSTRIPAAAASATAFPLPLDARCCPLSAQPRRQISEEGSTPSRRHHHHHHIL